MKALMVFGFLVLTAVAQADFPARINAPEEATSLGKIPVKYHEQYGPYKLWVLTGRNGVSNFEARFVTIKNGAYVFGLDDVATGVTKTKQMRIFALPMKRFSLQDQEAFRLEFQKRQKDLKEKRVTYPEPPPVVVAEKPAPRPVAPRRLTSTRAKAAAKQAEEAAKKVTP